MKMSNVKLAVRVRPMSSKEIEKKNSAIVKVENEHTISVTNLKVGVCGAGDSRTRVRRYTADYCFDSSLPADNPNHATQQLVFNSVGAAALDALRAHGGVCILAYGQSASGKTHTVLGGAGTEEAGLVPRLCDAIATKELRPVPNDGALLEPDDNHVEVFVSYLEIYNEKVRDLLAEGSEGNKELRVREHPRRGPYVQNAAVISVYGRVALRALVSRGTRARRTAPTSRNIASSRSHAVLAVARARGSGVPVLHAVDLAGSEKASPLGALGRQKEGANINRSLVALGNVIAALASSDRRSKYVPYRGSALTWLLKDSFGGGALTFMIATVSPSSCCYSETVNTLRWAARARLIPAARAHVTTVPAHAHVHALRAQLDAIYDALQRAGIRYIPESSSLILNEMENSNENITNAPNYTCTKTSVIDSSEQSKNVNAESIPSPTSSTTSGSLERILCDVKPSNSAQKIKQPEHKEDKLFGPSLRRTGSGHDLVITPPHRNKRHQYSSHEVLNSNKEDKSQHTSNESISTVSTQASYTDSKNNRSTISRPNSEKDSLNIIQSTSCSKPPILYQLENKRADIVASVTQRLYTKTKKKDAPNSPKSEGIVEKKIMEPLNELKICTNARQRLLEISQRALRTRRKIGIPAYTQTISSVVRVKEVAIDVQRDLEPFYVQSDTRFKLYQNVACETCPMTRRSKEASVGPINGSIDMSDKCIETDNDTNVIRTTSCGVMTEHSTKNSNVSTQTELMPPLRKKRISSFTKYLNPNHEHSDDTQNIPTIVNINISHQRYPNDTDEISDDSIDGVPIIAPLNFNMTPDLLSNHNSTEHDTSIPTAPKLKETKEMEIESNNMALSNILALNISVSGGNENIMGHFEQSLPSKELVRVAKQPNNEKIAMHHECNVKPSCHNNIAAVVKENGAHGVLDRMPNDDSMPSKCGRNAAPEDTLSNHKGPHTSSSQPNHTSQMALNDPVTPYNFKQCYASKYTEIFDDGEKVSLPRTCGDSYSTRKCPDTIPDMESMIMGNNSIHPYNLVTSPVTEKVYSTNKSVRKSVSFTDKNRSDRQFEPVPRLPHDRAGLREKSELGSQPLEASIDSDSDWKYESMPKFNQSESEILGSASDKLYQIRSHRTTSRSQTCTNGSRSEPRALTMDRIALAKTKYSPVYPERSSSYDIQSTQSPEPIYTTVSDTFDEMPIKSTCKLFMNRTIEKEPREICEPAPISHFSHEEEIDHLAIFREKRLFFEDKFRDAPNYIHSGINKIAYELHDGKSYDNLEFKVLQSCDRLEKSVKNHEQFLECNIARRGRFGKEIRTNRNRKSVFSDTGTINSPSEYLKKLLNLRKDIVSVTRNDESPSHSFHGFL